jgi:hypothetical protein
MEWRKKRRKAARERLFVPIVNSLGKWKMEDHTALARLTALVHKEAPLSWKWKNKLVSVAA